MDPIRTWVRLSLLRPMLVLGGERELVFSSGMVTAILIFAMNNLIFGCIGIGFWLLSLLILRHMGKEDPQLSKVYRRHMSKKAFYTGRSHFPAPEFELKKQQDKKV